MINNNLGCLDTCTLEGVETLDVLNHIEHQIIGIYLSIMTSSGCWR